MIDLGLAGKRAVVSGAGYIPGRAGHGRHTVLQLARAGARLACIDIDRGRAEDAAAEARAEGAEAHPVIADMTERHRALEFRRFLNLINRTVPDDLDVHLVVERGCDVDGRIGEQHQAVEARRLKYGNLA